MHKITLEICIDSIESAVAAKTGGAQRLEVCSGLAVGGTTPSPGLIEQCSLQTSLPLMVMIRPHDGGFIYSEDDIQIMLADIAMAKAMNAQGVVFGVLTPKRTVDQLVTRRLLEAARPMQVTFHRAFDICRDPTQALDSLIELGVDRVLTSGQASTALIGVDLIRQLSDHAAGRIALMPGSGIKPANVGTILQQTQTNEVHASASQAAMSNNNSSEPDSLSVAFGTDRRVTSAKQVRQLVLAIQNVCV